MAIEARTVRWATVFVGSLVLACSGESQMKGETYEVARQHMVERQIMGRGVSAHAVLDAMRNVERHLFVPKNLREMAYTDQPLPIGHGQTISQPYIVALMTELLSVAPTDTVLEIGTGSGYQAAVLSRIVSHVYTIEIIEALATEARHLLNELGCENVTVKAGDGYQGWPEHAPFDAIIVTAAPPKIPPRLLEQLDVDGKMVIPVGDVFQELQVITRAETGYQVHKSIPVRFVPMVGRIETE
jgi:protein-L-isoaspartate(D-aspartate) O-methyltransferase